MNYTVLVSSSNNNLIETIKYSFQSVGQKENISIVSVNNEDETLEVLDDDSVSLLILDDAMENYIQLIEKIRKKPLFGNKPLILTLKQRKDLDLLDVNGFIYKPLKEKELVDKSLNLLNNYYEQNRLIDEMFSQTKEHKKEVSKIELQHKQEMNLIKDRMLLIFTHELKTPLNAIINFSSYINRGLQKNTTPEKIDKYIELSKLVEANAKVLLGEINTLLDIARMKEHKLNFNLISLDLKDIVEELMQNYKLLYEKKVVSNLESIILKGDRASLVHIFENLFSNALKYAFSKVEVSILQDKYNFYMLIEDDGEGISDDQKDKVFELFEQSEQTLLNRRKEGTGIGLYIVKILCEHFNYKIELTNSPLGEPDFV